MKHCQPWKVTFDDRKFPQHQNVCRMNSWNYWRLGSPPSSKFQFHFRPWSDLLNNGRLTGHVESFTPMISVITFKGRTTHPWLGRSDRLQSHFTDGFRRRTPRKLGSCYLSLLFFSEIEGQRSQDLFFFLKEKTVKIDFPLFSWLVTPTLTCFEKPWFWNIWRMDLKSLDQHFHTLD